MTVHGQRNDRTPEETARLLHIALPKGNVYTRMRDELGELFRDEEFMKLYSTDGKPAESPGRLAMVTLMQFVENLTDRQAAEAVQVRIDWKYALGLELEDEGFDYTVLSEFRSRLITKGAEAQIFDKLLEVCQTRGLVKARGKQRTDSTHIMAAVRDLNRLECVGETVRQALEVLVDVVPEWLSGWFEEEWALRYGQPLNSYRLPKEMKAREEMGPVIGLDEFEIMNHVYAATAPHWLRGVPAIEALRRIWIQQYEMHDDQVRWRAGKDLPPAQELIGSLFDLDARTSSKRHMTWNGYKVHVTETCDADGPHLVTNVITTPASVPDVSVTPQVHDDLAAKNLDPAVHVFDSGYPDASELAHAKQVHEIEVFAPVCSSTSWQARQPQGFQLSDFKIDWTAQQVTCPQGQVSQSWRLGQDRFKNPRINVKFPPQTCPACLVRTQCTRSANNERRISFQPQPEYEALNAARIYQATAEFKARYNVRAGVEGTISQCIAAFGIRIARYFGLAKTKLEHLLCAAAMNFVRIDKWLTGTPHAKTRKSKLAHFAAAWA
jgi:transposase